MAAHGRAKGPVAPAFASHPNTPHHLRPGERINHLISSLEAHWSLGLKIRGLYSPSRSSPRDTPNKIYGFVQLLFYQNRPALDEAIEEFEIRAPTLEHEGRLSFLHELLSNAAKTGKLASEAMTPTIGQGKNLASSFREASKPAGPSCNDRRNERESCESYTTAIDPGSPTDEDTGDEMEKFLEARTPSPSPSSRSAHTLHQTSNIVSLKGTRKRASETPDNSGNASKLTKTFKGKQSVNAQPQFKEPTLAMAPSFHADPYESSSASTSFNKTTFSSQETADTTRTSFTSYRGDTDACKEGIQRPKLTRTGSATMGLLNDNDFVRGETHVQTASAMQSSSKMPHAIRNIPYENIFPSTLPKPLENIPYHVLFTCQRIALESDEELENIALPDAVRNLPNDPEAFWGAIDRYLIQRHKPAVKTRDLNPLWQAEGRQFDGFTFKGKIVLSPKPKGPIMCLNSLEIQKDRSCRFQRMFGSNRFLYLDIPKFQTSQSIRHTKGDMQKIQTQFLEWLLGERSFLGRKWRVFHIEDLKRSKTSHRSEVVHDKRVIMFATEGLGIEHPYTIQQMLDKFSPFYANQNQGFCKFYSRISLGLSRTIPTLCFEPEQIYRVDDKRATEDIEDTEFNDGSLCWQPTPNGAVMDDGCCIISVGAALLVRKACKEVTGVTGPLPSVVQARIGGAKGLWMLSAESFTKDPYHLKPWIKINNSQWKFDPPSDQSHHHRTFEVSNCSSAPSPSELHISFIPILVDRGVPVSVIASLIRECLELEREKLLELLSDPVKAHEWVHRNGTKTSTGIDARWQASLPVSLEEKILFLFESGFRALKTAYLAKSLERFIQMRQIQVEAKLRIPLAKSTFLYGVADPLGVLKPGEIQVQFSTSFVDETTDEKYLCLRDMEALVSRQPACRRSDIQKVRTVVHPKLSHLVDVAVFPSKGSFPLAGKLQGGDYDGDLFWICWESALVQPFFNAPAPVQSADPSRYRIQTRTEKVRDIIDPGAPEDVDIFLRKSLEFRSIPSLLGLVTSLIEKQAYRKNRIHSEPLEQLYDMHDLLVDAPKQGYVYLQTDFDHLVRSLGKPAGLPEYKKAMNDCTEARGAVATENCRKKRYRHNPNNILDHLYFDVIRAHNIETMRQVKSVLSQATELDKTLRYPVERLSPKRLVIKQELLSLSKKLDEVYRIWAKGWSSQPKTTELQNALIETCYQKYLAIQPDHCDNPTIEPWVEPYLKPGSCLWDTIKASALYSKFEKPESSSFVFTMAGSELAKLKANSFDKTRSIVLPLRANLKPKPIKSLVQYDEDGEDDEDFESALEDPLLD